MNRVRRDAEPDARLAHTGPERFTEGAHMNRIQVRRLSRGALAAALMPCSHARAEVFADGSGIALQQMAASTTEWLPELLDLAVRVLEICSAALLAYGAYLVVVRTLQEVVMRIGKHRHGIGQGTAACNLGSWRGGIAPAAGAGALVPRGGVRGPFSAPQPSREQ